MRTGAASAVGARRANDVIMRIKSKEILLIVKKQIS